MLFSATYSSPIGKVLIVANETSLVGAWFYKQKNFMYGIYEKISDEKNSICDKALMFFDSYFIGKSPIDINFKLCPLGTKFQKEVWNILLDIPYGKTITYGEIAKIIETKYGINKMSSRAIGNAISRNPISIIIPCHRVVGKNNKLTGYAAGLEKKKWLLEFEKNNLNTKNNN